MRRGSGNARLVGARMQTTVFQRLLSFGINLLKKRGRSRLKFRTSPQKFNLKFEILLYACTLQEQNICEHEMFGFISSIFAVL